MKITESLSSSQALDALEAAIRSLPGGDAAIDAAVLAEDEELTTP